jgi:ATP-dependent Lon protease
MSTEAEGTPSSAGQEADPGPALRRLPLVPLRDDVVFPRLIVPLSVGRRTSIAAINAAMDADKQVVLVAQRDPQIDDTKESDLYGTGTVAEINGMRQTPAGVQMLVGGQYRARIVAFKQFKPYIEVEVEPVPDQVQPGLELEAHMRSVKSLYEKYVEKYVEAGGMMVPEVTTTVAKTDDASYLADLVAAAPDQSLEQKQAMLETPGVIERLRLLALFLTKQIEILGMKAKIQKEVQNTIGKLQRDQMLREQLKVIRKELGEDEEGDDLAQLRKKIEESSMPEGVKERALKEVDRMQSIPAASPEVGIIRTYVDWLVGLPWGAPAPETWDIKRAATVLDQDHYGVEKIKERILEYMAVRQRSHSLRSPILCFVGPPGVGKTSLGKSIARALDRKFVRLSLGGIHDEAEIRGHRRTYIGAMPGRILQQMKQAETPNPVFMLDEIDKVGADWRGDPSSALLEVLDPEQNHSFSDHYLEVPYDLSQVLFITTANVVYTIIPPLRDRMEIIRLPGYTEEEKLRIAEQFLKPRQLREHALTSENLELPEETLRTLIREYTHEAGVRNLDREIANICRKIPRRIAEGDLERVVVRPADLVSYLGPSRFDFGQVGAATGVAVNEYGGDVMTVEAIAMEGQGEFALTGQIGKVMEESARAAVSYARAHALELGIKPEFFRDHFLHIHVPAGAIPKDGPSAGITMATAVVSVLTDRAVRRDVAMTGEITLRGKVLPIGGLKEKLLAAHRAGITTFILPEKNRKDLHDVPAEVKEAMELIFVKHVEEVLAKALLPHARPAAAVRTLGFHRQIAGQTGTVN